MEEDTVVEVDWDAVSCTVSTALDLEVRRIISAYQLQSDKTAKSLVLLKSDNHDIPNILCTVCCAANSAHQWIQPDQHCTSEA